MKKMDGEEENQPHEHNHTKQSQDSSKEAGKYKEETNVQAHS